MRIHKWLAESGIASRRGSEKLIQEGRVTVNHQVASIGQIIDPEKDRIQVDRKILKTLASFTTEVLLYNKPSGEIVSRHDPEKRRNVFQALPRAKNGRWISIGRLDFNTSGLLLFTNNGTLANQLMHPSSGVEKEYAVRIRGEISAEDITTFKTGIALEDGMAQCVNIEERGGEGHNRWYHLTMIEGRNRIIRRMMAAKDKQVSRLIRVRYAHLTLPAWLSHGKVLPLETQDIDRLQTLVKNDDSNQPAQ